jgi:hypothetical protein
MDFTERFLLGKLRELNFSAIAIDTIEAVFQKRSSGEPLSRLELELLDTVVLSLEQLERGYVTLSYN